MSLSFDATFYQSQRPDVYNAFIATAGSTGLTWAEFAQQHYNTFGRFEGSDPSASFSTSYYLSTYPDVAAAGVNPFDHFLASGSLEMRQPYSTFPTSSFVAADYAAANPDLAAAGITSDAALYQHFVIHGQFEGRSGAPDVSIPNSGSTFTLTTDIDNLTGTSGDDVFNGVNGTTDTFTLPDTIDGGAGNDTLSLIIDTGGTVPGATVTNIETLQVRNTVALDTGGNGAIDLGNFSSVTSFESLNNTEEVELDNVGTSVTSLSMNGSRDDLLVDTGAITTVNLMLNNVNGAAANDDVDFGVTAASTAVTTLNVTSSGNSTLEQLNTNEVTTASFAATGGSVNIVDWNAAAALKTLTTSGSNDVTFGDLTNAAALETVTHSGTGTANFDLGTALAATVTSVTASSSGALKVTSGAKTTAITGGSGNDEIGIGALVYDGSAKVDGGDGTGDILSISDSTATIFTAGAKANISNFEILKVASGATETFDFEALTGLTGLIIDTATSAVVTNLSSTAAADVAVTGVQTTGLNVGVKNATNPGTTDTLKLSLDHTTADTAVTVAGFTSLGLENLQINSSGAGTNTNTFELAGANDRLSTVTITGDSKFTLTDAADIGTEVSIDASAATNEITITMDQNTSGQSITGSSTAKNTITGGTAVDIITGGAGVDIVNGAAGKDTISTAGGNDVVTVDVNNSNDTITIGDGADTVKFSGANFAAMLATSSDVGGIVSITDFVAGTDKIGMVDTGGANTGITLQTAQTIATAANLTDVYAGITAIGASVDGGALNGVLVTVSGGAAAGTYLYINDATGAVSNTDDFLINVTGVTGTITASDFVFA
ncbi:calcium-binding protein [Labrenzia sp. PHM005]|uniref:beta strand repeat-containing protein n=1 Tax=Labrenzia sp. PHM005 TaxID=2590016 RepID=UPI001140573D|nr:calcium-binding protein [Labrenzia sp. PHM005]QDG74945.1 calcium-binding protein [Labrenzia sp. PHM005]